MAGLSGAPRQSTAPFTMLPRGVTHQESSRIIGKLCCSSGARSHNNRGVPVRKRSTKAEHEGAQDTHPQAQFPSPESTLYPWLCSSQATPARELPEGFSFSDLILELSSYRMLAVLVCKAQSRLGRSTWSTLGQETKNTKPATLRGT